MLLEITGKSRSLVLVPSDTGEPRMEMQLEMDFSSIDLLQGTAFMDPAMEDPVDSSNSMVIEMKDLDANAVLSCSQPALGQHQFCPGPQPY